MKRKPQKVFRVGAVIVLARHAKGALSVARDLARAAGETPEAVAALREAVDQWVIAGQSDDALDNVRQRLVGLAVEDWPSAVARWSAKLMEAAHG